MNKNRVRSVLRILLGIAGSLLLLHSLWQLVASWALHATLKAQLRAGLPSGLHELTPPTVPPEDNAAILLQTAFELIQKDRNGPPAPHPLVAEIIQYRLDPSPTGGFGRDLRTLDRDAQKALREKLRTEPVATILTLLRQAAEKPACNFELDLSKGPSVFLPHLIHMRSAVRLLIADAWLRALADDLRGCLENLRVCFRVTQRLGTEALLLSQIVRIYCDSLAIGCLHEVLSRHEPAKIPAEEAHTLFAELYRHFDPGFALFVRALDGERVSFGTWFFRTILSSKMSPADFEALGIREVPWLYTTYLWRPLLKMEFRNYLRAMSLYRERVAQPYSTAISELAGEESVPRYCFMARRMMSAVHKSYVASVGHQAEIAMARLGLALCLHHQSRKAYPDSLEQLPLFPAPPLDPFTNAPFRYIKTKDGFLLRSAGPNGRDDGDKPGSDDLVWQVGRKD